MSYNFKQAFWAVIFDISDIGEKNRQRLANAAAALQKSSGILIAISAGGRTAQESPEISLVVAINADISALLSEVKAALKNAELPDNVVQLRPDIRFHTFTDLQLRHILQSVAIPTDTTPLPAPTNLVRATVPSSDGLVSHADLSFSVISSRQQALIDDKNTLRDELESLRSMFRELSTESKSSAAVVLLAREGLVTVGAKMWLQFVNTTITGSIITAIEPLISAIGGITSFRAVVTTIATPLSNLSPNVASNFVVLVNEQAAPLKLTGSTVLTGSKGAVVDDIGGIHQPTKGSPVTFSCGLHLSYRDVQGTSDLDSGIGLALQRDSVTPPADFSLGAYTANSSNGKTNSVRLKIGANAAGVESEASSSNNATDKVTVGITGSFFEANGRRQDANGARNYVLGRFVPL